MVFEIYLKNYLSKATFILVLKKLLKVIDTLCDDIGRNFLHLKFENLSFSPKRTRYVVKDSD